MSRRVLAVLAACCIAALSVTAVAFAHGDHHDGKAHKRSTHAKRGGQPAAFLSRGLFAASLNSLAQRLSVDPATLRSAVKAVAQEQRDKKLTAAGLTPDEIAALKACRSAAMHKRAGCDGGALKSARTKLKAARKAKPDLTALKTELATSLATKIGKSPDEVLAAVRAELDARLTQAVQAGWLTQKGHDLALACFDTPASCDMQALKGEVRLFGHQRHDQPSTADQSSGSGSSSAAPSGTMTPGARATSTPLR